MRISLPIVRIGDNAVRFINCSLHNGNFTIPNYIEVIAAFREKFTTQHRTPSVVLNNADNTDNTDERGQR